MNKQFRKWNINEQFEVHFGSHELRGNIFLSRGHSYEVHFPVYCEVQFSSIILPYFIDVHKRY